MSAQKQSWINTHEKFLDLRALGTSWLALRWCIYRVTDQSAQQVLQNCLEAIKQRDKASLLRRSPMLVHVSGQGGHFGKPLVHKREHFSVSTEVESKPMNFEYLSGRSSVGIEFSANATVRNRCVKRLTELILSLGARLFILSADTSNLCGIFLLFGLFCMIFLSQRRPLDILPEKECGRQGGRTLQCESFKCTHQEPIKVPDFDLKL